MPTRPRAWEKVLASIEADLISGSLAPGDRLPGERSLAATYGVGRTSAREALRVLEAMGLLRAQTGSGPEAGAIIVARPDGGMRALMRLQVAARAFPVNDVVSTRLVLESAVLGDLAGLPVTPDLSAADELLDTMDRPGLDRNEFLALDAQFHVCLVEAGGNQVMSAMMGGLRDSIERYVVEGAAALPSWDATRGRLRSEHRGLVDAVRRRDPDLARQRVADHITGYFEEIGIHA